jgi:hypothetical protein
VRLLRDHIYYYDDLVVGGNLGALLHAHNENTPILINKKQLPHRFEEIEIQSKKINKLELWNKLYFLLSLGGNVIAGDSVTSMRIKENDILATVGISKNIKFIFKRLFIWDDENIHGLPLPIKKNDKFQVLDWMVARTCKHSVDFLSTDEDFVREIYFYPSERTSGNHPEIKDLVAISYLTEKQIQDFEYSDTYARFKALNVLTTFGVKGVKNGFSTSDSSKQIHYSLKLEVQRREIKKIKMNEYQDTDSMKFCYSLPDRINFKNKFNEKLEIL